MADKVFSSRNFPGSSNTQTQKSNGDCYDLLRGYCSRGAGDEKVSVKKSGLFSHHNLFSVFFGTDGWWRVFDFSVLNGSFEQLPGANGAITSFRGAGSAGLKMAFSLCAGAGTVSHSLSGDYFQLPMVLVVTPLQQLMTPVLKPLLGIPGICSLALIANLQNTDAAAGMTKSWRRKVKLPNAIK